MQLDRITRAAVVLAAVLSAACVRTRRDPVTGRLDVDVESPLKKGEDWSAKMTGTEGFGSATGQARAAVIDGQSTITVRVTGLRSGDVHPWIVLEGKCGTTGAPFGNPSLYPPITVDAQGLAEGAARIPVALDEAKNYQVRLYVSPSATSTIAVCGDLSD